MIDRSRRVEVDAGDVAKLITIAPGACIRTATIENQTRAKRL